MKISVSGLLLASTFALNTCHPATATEIDFGAWPAGIDESAFTLTAAPAASSFSSCANMVFNLSTKNVTAQTLSIGVSIASISVFDAAGSRVSPSSYPIATTYNTARFKLEAGLALDTTVHFGKADGFADGDCKTGNYTAVVHELLTENAHIIDSKPVHFEILR